MTATTDQTGLKLLEVREQIQKQLNSTMLETSLFNPLISPGPASITLLQSNSPKNDKRMRKHSHSHSHQPSHQSSLSASPPNSIAVITCNNSCMSSSSSTSLSSDSSRSIVSNENKINSTKQQKSEGNNASSNNNRKGLVAAAALSLAVTRPFPAKKMIIQNNNNNSTTTTTSHSSNTKHTSNNTSSIKNIPDSYVLSKQTNILTCQCGKEESIININNDKNSLIQCHNCNRWQHMKCYGLKNKLEILPLKFYCHICQPELTIKNYKISKKIIDKNRLKNKLIKLNALENITTKTELDVAKQLTKIRGNIIQQQQQQNQQQPQQPQQFTYNNIPSTTILSTTIPSTIIPQVQPPTPPQIQPPTPPQITRNETATQRSSSIASLLSNTSSEPSLEPMNHQIMIPQFKDKYVKGFIKSHNNDDWVIQMNKQLILPIESTIIESKSIHTPSTQTTINGIFTKVPMKRGDMISEISGEIDFQKNYVVNPDNQYRILGTSQPKTFFHPHWPIFIDTEKWSHDISFMIIKDIRRSCQPNVELKTIRVPVSSSDTCDIHFVFCATKDIQPGEELLIKWQWDLRHPICRTINDNQMIDKLNDMDKFWLIHSIDTIWQTAPCACESNHGQESCSLWKVKRYAEKFHHDLKMNKNKLTFDKIHK